ncbi:polysaccharide deacetylase family protein [Neobacillus mesonae]|uniref:polysaccharide deacetylase family protein n=1 Tax=Neobacillus mesonae TaxID=1193713 RepID=UPI00203AA814|nr:polysaccharide deacetylase family protein [Neobacillus mesonae]MCM3571282.1 polysaccharide deacetylase family protein [Neobacillus mesonae]
MKRKYTTYLISFSIMLVLTLGISTNPYKVMSQGSNFKSENITSIEINKDDLYKKIQEYRNQHKIKPIDAKVDRIWKAIPGYNGLDVNIEASYQKMKSTGDFDKNKVVYKEKPPNVHLENLGPNPIYKGNPEKPMVALLINVAWGNEYIPTILTTLKESKVKATFFFDGSWVKKNPDLAKMIYREGHEIGNHAYSHPDLKKRSKSDTIQELEKTNALIEETIGIKPKWFAPPSGSFNQVTVQVANDLHMRTILWTVDTVDWKKPSASEMVSRIITNVDNGSMVLMHPTKPVAEGLEDMIKGIKEKGYQLGTVSDLMSEKRIDKTS